MGQTRPGAACAGASGDGVALPARLSTYDGERCSIVTCARVGAIAGTSVTAVAPLPITTTFLARPVEVGRPVLRVDDRAAELVRAGELRLVAVLVVVVAAAAPQEARGERHRLAVVLGLDRPARGRRCPTTARTTRWS